MHRALCILFWSPLYSQSPKQQFKKLSCPEKWWVYWHPFVAKKALLISMEARTTSKEMEKDSLLDHDADGGQVDAFRHSYWMARLAQEICWRKALKLGKAHEKGDYIAFKKHELEEGATPDSIAGAMDLYNNKVGIVIGKENKLMSKEELRNLLLQRILNGNMKIIRKDIHGNSLDCEGNIIKMKSYQHTWSVPRCLVDSNQK